MQTAVVEGRQVGGCSGLQEANPGDCFQESSFKQLYQTDVFQHRKVLMKKCELDPVLISFFEQIHSSYVLFTAKEEGPVSINKLILHRTLHKHSKSLTVNQMMPVETSSAFCTHSQLKRNQSSSSGQ